MRTFIIFTSSVPDAFSWSLLTSLSPIAPPDSYQNVAQCLLYMFISADCTTSFLCTGKWRFSQTTFQRNTLRLCSCFLRFVASFFFLFLRCFAVSSFSTVSPAFSSAIFDVFSLNNLILIQSNAWRLKPLTNQISKINQLEATKLAHWVGLIFPEIQRFVYKQKFVMSSAMDVEVSTHYFLSETVDFYHDFEGECEDCGRIVPEWSLLQCQYGFCGKFSCTKCGFRCRNCGQYEDRSVSLCLSHALMVYPPCDRCKKQFCDVCSTISVNQVCLLWWRGI